MADIQPIKPIKLCINITIPTIDDDSISLYECVGILGNKLQEAIQKINESLGSLEDVYRPENPPPYPVTSVNRAETKDVITVFEPEGGGIEDVSQAELIAAYKAGARLGAFNQDNGTCRLYHFNLYIDPERVDYKEVAGGGASGVTSVNGRTGAVNIFNAPISAATAASVTELASTTQEQLNNLKNNLSGLKFMHKRIYVSQSNAVTIGIDYGFVVLSFKADGADAFSAIGSTLFCTIYNNDLLVLAEKHASKNTDSWVRNVSYSNGVISFTNVYTGIIDIIAIGE